MIHKQGTEHISDMDVSYDDVFENGTHSTSNSPYDEWDYDLRIRVYRLPEESATFMRAGYAVIDYRESSYCGGGEWSVNSHTDYYQCTAFGLHRIDKALAAIEASDDISLTSCIRAHGKHINDEMSAEDRSIDACYPFPSDRSTYEFISKCIGNNHANPNLFDKLTTSVLISSSPKDVNPQLMDDSVVTDDASELSF